MNGESYWVALAPEWVLLTGACVALTVGVLRGGSDRAWTSAVALLTVATSLIIAVRRGVPDGSDAALGLWLTPLTYYTRVIALGVGGLIVLVNWHQPAPGERGEYMALVLFSLLGVLLTASANDLVVLFMAVELVSVPTYVLVALSRADDRASEAAVKYFFLGALSAAVLAYGLSFLYGASGTTTMFALTPAGAAPLLPGGSALSGVALIGVLLTFCGLAFKIAAVPFHAYAPDVYEGAAAPVTGMLGFVPKLAGFVALARLFAMCNWELPAGLFWSVWVVAGASMTVGNVLALLQKNVKRMLAYSGIAHTGYMLIGLLVGPGAGEGPMRDGVAAMLFYIAVYGLMNLGAFALLTAFRTGDREVETLGDLGGLSARSPALAIAFAVCVFSLMGFPPTAGFLGKLYIFSGAFSLGNRVAYEGPLIVLAVIGVVNSAIGAAYYLRIVASTYMGGEATEVRSSGGVPVRLGLVACSVTMLLLFAWPGGLLGEAREATTALRTIAPVDESRVAVGDGESGALSSAPTVAHPDASLP